MKKRSIFFTLVLFILCMILPCSVHAEEKKVEPQKVLFISSYSSDWYNTREQLRGILNSINSEVTVDTYYMDTKNKAYTDEYEKSLCEYFLNNKSTIESTYTAIITGDDVALNFVYKHHNALFPNMPVIFEGVNDIQMANKVAAHPLFVGVCEKADYVLTLEFACKLLPSAKIVNVIYDSSAGGLGELDQFRNEVASYKTSLGFNYVNASEYTKEELKTKFKSFGKNEINYFLILSECEDGIVSASESIEFIKEIDAPVFRVNAVGGDDVFLGGYLYSHYFAGQLAASFANICIEGEQDIKDYHTSYTASFTCTVNYRIFKKYGFDKTILPEDAVLLEYNPSFFQMYQKELTFGSLLLVVIVVISLLLILLVLKYHRQNKKLKYFNDYDEATGLFSKRKLESDMIKYIYDEEAFSLLVIDVDNFKLINDYYGHKNADTFLEKLGKGLLHMQKDNITLYRFGSDEFAAIVVGNDFSQVEEFAKKVIKIHNNVITIESNEITFTLSVGIAKYPEHGEDNFTLYSAADSAMYYVKDSVKNNYAIYNPSIMYDSRIEAIILENLKASIDAGDIYMVYQPIYDTKKQVFNGAEALMRIKNFGFGPEKFIPVAEKSGLMITMGRIAAAKVIDTLKNFKDAGIKDFHISVNYSGAQIMDENYIDYVSELLDEKGIDYSSFQIEFTESINIIDERKVHIFFNKCKEKGFKILLDDFGTGYSSISNLTKYHYSVVKFDKGIINNMFNNSFQSLLAYCHSLGHEVVAEGVETEEQFTKLKDLGVEHVQGYYFYRPLDVVAFEKEMKKIYKK